MAVGLAESVISLSRHSAVRFVLVGGASFVADAGALFLLHGVLRLWLPLATVLAYGVAFVINFGLNRGWAFGSTGALGGQVHRYLWLVAANLVLTVVGVQGLTWLGLVYLGSKLVTSTVLAVLNYVAFRRWVFR